MSLPATFSARLLAALFAVVLSAVAPSGRAQDARPAEPALALPAPASSTAAARRPAVMEISGPITADLVHKVRRALENVAADPFPAAVLLLINSPGGDALAAMEIGRLVRAARVHALVRGRCVSACVFVLAGSVMRGVAEDGVVGIHRGRVSTLVRNVGEVDLDPASDPRAAQVLDTVERMTADYLREMGMPEELFQAMRSVPGTRTRLLQLAELPALGLSGFDARYRSTRLPAGSAQYGISEAVFEQRTQQVAGKCARSELRPLEVLACYRRVLQTGE